MKYLKTYEDINNKIEYDDYIIYNLYYFNHQKHIPTILKICGTPGPKGHKVDYYMANIIMRLNDDNIVWVNTIDSIRIYKDDMEEHLISKANSLKDAKEKLLMLVNVNKYNL